MAWTPASPTTDGGVSPEHWYRGDDAYEENTRVTACSDDGDPVGSWTDLTGNADHVSQGTADNRPSWQDAELNGEPVIRFDGNNDYLRGAFTTGGSISQPNTIFAVAKLTSVNDDAQRILFDGDDVTSRHVFHQFPTPDPDEWAIWAGSNLAGSASDGNWNIWTALFNGASSQFWANGVSEASGNAGTKALDGLTAGCSYMNDAYWEGDIAEIIIYDANLSAADRDEV